MKRFFVILSLLLTFGVSGQAALAQTDPTMGTALTDLEGLESAYSRTYSVDYMALMSTPNADMTDTSAFMRSVSIQGLTFDSDDRAKEYLGDQLEQIDASLDDQAAAGMTMEKSETEIEGTDVTVLTMEMEEAGMVGTFHVFRDDNVLYLISVLDADVEASDKLATDVTTFILKADDDSTAEVVFKEDGTSTGGIFDRMPKAGDEMLNGLDSVMDIDLLSM